MMLPVAGTLIVIATVMALARGFIGPTVYDRVLALNSFGTLATLMIAVAVFIMDEPDFLDIALLYVLINFVGPIAILRFVEQGEPDDADGDAAVAPER